jgi:hypothetical protein
MIDQWFKKDIQAILKQHTVAVFIDESGAGQFLLNTIDGEFTLYETHSEIEELHAKYLIERNPHGQRNIIYTHTPKEKLNLSVNTVKPMAALRSDIYIIISKTRCIRL